MVKHQREKELIQVYTLLYLGNGGCSAFKILESVRVLSELLGGDILPKRTRRDFSNVRSRLKYRLETYQTEHGLGCYWSIPQRTVQLSSMDHFQPNVSDSVNYSVKQAKPRSLCSFRNP